MRKIERRMVEHHCLPSLGCDSLPRVEGTVESLTREDVQLWRENAELVKRLEILREQNEWLKQRFFGRHSQALSEEERRQLKLFDEAEFAAARETVSILRLSAR